MVLRGLVSIKTTLSSQRKRLCGKLPTTDNGQQQPSSRSRRNGRGLRYPSDYVCFVPGLLASQAHQYSCLSTAGIHKILGSDCFHFTVHMDELPSSLLAYLHNTRLQSRPRAML